MGLRDVSQDQERGGIATNLAALERVTLPEVAVAVTAGLVLGQRASRAHVTLFNHFAMPLSLSPAVGRKVPSIISSCEVLGMSLRIVSRLDPE